MMGKCIINYHATAEFHLTSSSSLRRYNVWSVNPLTRIAADTLRKLEYIEGFDFLLPISMLNKSATLIVPPKHQLMFRNLLKNNYIDSQFLIENLEQ